MKRNFTYVLLTAFVCAVTVGSLKAQTISTVAGRFVPEGASATTQGLYAPQGVALDNSGNIYFSDWFNRIRKINTSGIITTVGGYGYGAAADHGDGGPATDAVIYQPIGVAVDTLGNIFLSTTDFRIRKINTAGIISTIAGNGINGFGGDGGPATAAEISYAAGVAVDKMGNVYFSDMANLRMRKISTSGIISTIAGNGTAGYGGDDSAATIAMINYAWGVCVDTSGNIYFSDGSNNRIRKINTSGIITTVAGNGAAGFSGDGGPATAAELNSPWGLCVDKGGNVIIADVMNNRIRKISPAGIITTIAGDSVAGRTGDGGAATLAELTSPYGVATNKNGNICLIDGNNLAVNVRMINDSGIIRTIAGNTSFGYTGDGTAATATLLGEPVDCFVDSTGNMYIADQYNYRIRKVNTSGIISTFAGTGAAGYSGDGGPATAATMNRIWSVTGDNRGNIYFSDYNNFVVRKITSSGIISTVAGNNTAGYGGDHGPATAAMINSPAKLAFDNNGNLYIGDWGNQVVRKVDTAGIITTVVGTGANGNTGDGGPATAAELSGPSSIIFDHSGNMYIGDLWNNNIRKVDTAGIIHTIAGNGAAGYAGDGGPATAAEFNGIQDIAFDRFENIYIADQNNNVIRKINTSGIVSTFAGNDTAGFLGDGGSVGAAEFYTPTSIKFDHSGNIYIADSYNNRIRFITAPLNVPENAVAKSMFAVYPNPTTSSFTVSIAGNGKNISSSLLDITGKVIETKSNVSTNEVSFQPQGLSSGIYIVSVVIDGKTYNQKITILDK